MKISQELFIDTDMGNDDIMAICMLLLLPYINILGITTVNGVSGIKKGTKNLIRLLSYLNKPISVVPGCSELYQDIGTSFPKRDIKRAENLTLLNRQIIPIVKQAPTSLKAVEQFIFESCVSNTTLLALGPLTNIAKTIDLYGKEFTQKISKIILMGGGLDKGNVPPLKKAEYNIWLDPKSAQKVFSSELAITMVGIDATSKVPARQTFKVLVKKIKCTTLETRIIQQIILNNDSDFDAFYDPLAIAILNNSKLITKKRITTIKVMLDGDRKGVTVPMDTSQNNTHCVLDIDKKEFYRFVINLLKGGE